MPLMQVKSRLMLDGLIPWLRPVALYWLISALVIWKAHGSSVIRVNIWIFKANQLTTSAEFKKRLLHIAKGAVYTGSTKQLDKFIQMRLPEFKELKTQNFIGYNKDHAAWLFSRVAVCDGRLYEMNDED